MMKLKNADGAIIAELKDSGDVKFTENLVMKEKNDKDKKVPAKKMKEDADTTEDIVVLAKGI